MNTNEAIKQVDFLQCHAECPHDDNEDRFEEDAENMAECIKAHLYSQDKQIEQLLAKVAELEQPVVFGGDVVRAISYTPPNIFNVCTAFDQSARIGTPAPDSEFNAPVVAQFVFRRIESLDSVLATLTELRAKMAEQQP